MSPPLCLHATWHLFRKEGIIYRVILADIPFVWCMAGISCHSGVHVHLFHVSGA